MTTLRRELRTKISKVLEEQGIYTDAIPPMPSIVDLLTDAVLGVAGISRAYANAEMMGEKSRDTAKERMMLAERIEAQLFIKVDHSPKWTRALNRIIEEEEKGNTLEKYIKWYNKNENRFDRPKTSQILNNPYILFQTWPKAMADYNDTELKML